MNNTMIERFNVAGAQLSKLYGRRADENATFAARATRVADIGIKRALFGRVFFTALTLLGSLASALAFGWGGVMTIHHMMDLGTLVALVSYLGRLYGPITGLSNIQVTVMTALVSFEQAEVLDLPSMILESWTPFGVYRCSGNHVRSCLVPLSHRGGSVAGVAGIHRGAGQDAGKNHPA